MTQGYIGVGSNIDRDRHIAQGITALQRQFGELTLSSIYESAPVGFTGEPFYNLVVGFESDLDAKTVAKILRDIEYANGRGADSKKFTARTLDLDLLVYGDLIIDDGSLKLPRDDIDRYAFVLEPLAEIAPEQLHPLHQLSYAELWRRMDKHNLAQRRIVDTESLCLRQLQGIRFGQIT